MRLRDHYDWVVLGDHPGALLSAGLVARLGLSVLWLPLLPSASVVVSKSGQCLDPEPNFMLGLSGAPGGDPSGNGLLWECLERMGISDSERTRIRGGELALPQILTHESRAHFRADPGQLERELVREFGAGLVEASGVVTAFSRSRGPMSEYWAAFPERLSLSQSQSPGKNEGSRFRLAGSRGSPSEERLRKELEANPDIGKFQGWLTSRKKQERRPLEDFLRGLSTAFSAGSQEGIHAPALMHLMSMSAAAGTFQGGMTAYRRMLVAIAKRCGVQTPDQGECKRLFVDQGRLVGVQASHHGSMIGVKGGVLGCSLEHVRELLAVSGKSWLHKLKDGPVPKGWRFTLALTVSEEALPPGLMPRSFWFEPGAPELEIEIASPSDYESHASSRSAATQRLIFLRTILPFTRESLDLAYQRAIASRMFRQAAEILPFLEGHVARIYPDFRTENPDFSEAFGYASPELIPENLRCMPEKGIGSQSGIESLFLATGESYPEFGTFGGTIAALEASAWIAHLCGLSGPFRESNA